jgi:hypothetical protein
MTEESGVVTAPPGLPPVGSPASRTALTAPTKSLAMFLILPERSKQRRWTVLLRAFLAIPLTVVTILVAIATEVCVVVGWFAALVIGRVPKFVRTIVTVFLRLSVRLGAYLFLLTDRFPPFTMDDVPQYGVSIAVPPASRMNRAAVLFRVILVIPAAIVARLVGLGAYVLSVFAWVAALVTGWLPKPVHGVYQAFIRYEMRVIGYFALLVPTYPDELFGDLEPVGRESAEPGASETTVGPAEQGAPRQPWLLILGMGAKRLLLVVVLLGVAVAIGLGVLNASLGNHENLVQANNQLVSNVDQFSKSANGCQALSCLEQADGLLAQQLDSFVSTLQNSSHAGVSQELVGQMVAAAQNTASVLSTLSQSGPSVNGYRSLAARLHVEQSFTQLGNVQQRFANAVNATPLG